MQLLVFLHCCDFSWYFFNYVCFLTRSPRKKPLAEYLHFWISTEMWSNSWKSRNLWSEISNMRCFTCVISLQKGYVMVYGTAL